MPVKQYNASIRITSLKGADLGGAVAMSPPQDKAFIDFVKDTLDTLKKTSTGRKLIKAVGATGHQVTIFCAEDGKDNVASKNPSTIANDIAAAIKPFRPRHKNLPLNIKDKANIVASYKADMVLHGQATKKAQVAPELADVLMRARVKYPDPVLQLSRKVGLSVSEFGALIAGEKAMSDTIYYKLCFILYDFLTPGPGCDTQIRFQPEDKFKQGFSGDFDEIERGRFTTKTTVWRRLAAAVLGHELIHAWRMMAGRRLVTGGWEEEAMTAGVGPFLNWQFTENALRAEMHMPLRAKYQTGSCSSEYMNGVMMNMNWGGTVPTDF